MHPGDIEGAVKYGCTSAVSGVCSRCSRIYGSCCVTPPGCTPHPTLVSDYEAAAITGFLQNDNEIFSKEPNAEPFIKMVGSLFPDYLADVVKCYNLAGSHRTLKIDCFGRCSLLGKDGCILPHDVRPFFCRIYPFWFIGNELKTFVNDRCLALNEADETGVLLEMFNTNKENLNLIFNMLLFYWLGIGTVTA